MEADQFGASDVSAAWPDGGAVVQPCARADWGRFVPLHVPPWALG